MNLSRRLVVCSLLAPALGSSLGEQKIRFGPAPGTRLEKVSEVDFDFSLDDFSLVVDGEDVGAVMGGFDMSVSGEQRVVVVDRYVSIGDGRPQELLRSFDALGGLTSVSFVSDFASHDEDLTSSSVLEGRTVRFVWDEKEGGFRKTFEDGKADSVTEGLEEDMDFRVLLPSRPVSEGDTWEVPLLDLRSVAAPGGNLRLLPEGGDAGDIDAMTEMFEEKFGKLAELLDGTCMCTFEGLRAEDPHLAEITIELDVEADVDLTDLILELIDAFSADIGDEEFPDLTIDTADFSIEMEGSGTLVWNVAENRISSFSMSVDAVLSMDFSVSMEIADESHEAEFFLEMSGSTSQTLTASE